MNAREHEFEPRHPIGVVSGRTGLPQDVLRAWERRYEAVVPHRTSTGRRLYSDRDVERLALLRDGVASGRRISDLASLELRELRRLVQDDAPVPHAVERPDGKVSRKAQKLCAEAVEAARELDTGRLKAVLARAAVELPAPVLRTGLIQPLLARLGDAWRAGAIRIAHEHLATGVIRSFLDTVRWSHDVPVGAPAIIVATPSGQPHEVGALLVSLAAGEIGWEVVYLGVNVPAVEIAAAVRQKEARAVALSISSTVGDAGAGPELHILRSLLGHGFPLFVGGRAARAYEAVLDEIDATQVPSPADLQILLDRLVSV